jgi:hypothetical protein
VVMVGSPVTWTYQVTNTGDVQLSAVAVTDDRGIAVACPKATLLPLESMTCTATGTAVAGQYANVGTAVGTPPAGPAVQASDPRVVHRAACRASEARPQRGCGPPGSCSFDLLAFVERLRLKAAPAPERRGPRSPRSG